MGSETANLYASPETASQCGGNQAWLFHSARLKLASEGKLKTVPDFILRFERAQLGMKGNTQDVRKSRLPTLGTTVPRTPFRVHSREIRKCAFEISGRLVRSSVRSLPAARAGSFMESPPAGNYGKRIRGESGPPHHILLVVLWSSSSAACSHCPSEDRGRASK